MFRGGPAENVGKFGNMTIPYILPRLSDQSDRPDLSSSSNQSHLITPHPSSRAIPVKGVLTEYIYGTYTYKINSPDFNPHSYKIPNGTLRTPPLSA